MEQIEKIQRQYERHELFESILSELTGSGVDLTELKREDLSSVDEFHVRGAEVSHELAEFAHLYGVRWLDVGCGIGGPARMLADEFHGRVTGIDLNPEFIRTARGLTKLLALQDRTDFVCGNALELPFSDGEFDAIWTQHVQMNIAEKILFVSELKRVLRPSGVFIFYDIFSGQGKDFKFPVPWADSPAISHLVNFDYYIELVRSQGFRTLRIKDETPAGIEFFDRMLTRMDSESSGTPGLKLILGHRAADKIKNLLGGLKSGALELHSCICKLVE